MSLETSFGIVTILIIAAALGGYMISQIKQAALLEQHGEANRALIASLREAVKEAEDDAQQLAADLDHCIQQLHLYEQAWHGQSADHENAGDPLLHPASSDAAPRFGDIADAEDSPAASNPARELA